MIRKKIRKKTRRRKRKERNNELCGGERDKRRERENITIINIQSNDHNIINILFTVYFYFSSVFVMIIFMGLIGPFLLLFINRIEKRNFLVEGIVVYLFI